jgi:hypothetical protein
LLLFHLRRWAISTAIPFLGLTVEELLSIYFFIPATLSCVGMVLTLIAMGRDGNLQADNFDGYPSSQDEVVFGFLYIGFGVLPLSLSILGNFLQHVEICKQYFKARRRPEQTRKTDERRGTAGES